MRYLPLDASEREAMLSRIGVPDIEALFADIPADKRIQGLLDMPLAKSEMAVERAMTRDRQSQRRRRIGSVFSRLGRLPATHSCDRRSSHPAVRIPDELYALSTGDRARHAASPVRVSDPGGGANRNGGRERLDVRRLDRVRRGDVDGPSPDAAEQVGDFRRAASAVCRRLRDAGAYGGRQNRPLAAGSEGERRHRRGDRQRDELRDCSVARLLRQSARSDAHRRGGARARRSPDCGLHRSGCSRRRCARLAR